MKEQIDQDRPLAVALLDKTPAGSIVLAASEKGLAYLSFQRMQDFQAMLMDENRLPDSRAQEIAHAAIRQVQEYFDHRRKAFDLPLDLDGMPDFRRKVLTETARIPYGTTLSYGEVAACIGQPKAARAVGGALARNPLALVIPCHRVVAGDGSMHGFSAAGGIATKVILLRLEGLAIREDRLAE